MATASNDIAAYSNVYGRSDADLGTTSVIYSPVRTPNLRKADSLTVFAIPQDTSIKGWHLKSALLGHLRPVRKQWIATTWLEGVEEYGTGKTESEAVVDLVTSLGEYRLSLEKREKNIGELTKRELGYLRRLIEPSPELSI